MASVLSGCWDKTLRLWDVASGNLVRTFDGQSAEVESVALSPIAAARYRAAEMASVDFGHLRAGKSSWGHG
jgi:WD40 repeat protein